MVPAVGAGTVTPLLQGLVSSPAGAGRPGCRADPPQPNYAQEPAAPWDRAPGGLGAWRIRTPDRGRGAPGPGWSGAAVVLAPDRPAVRRAVVGLELAPGPGEPAGHSPAFFPAPLPPRGGRDRRRQAAAADPPCASPDARRRPPRRA